MPDLQVERHAGRLPRPIVRLHRAAQTRGLTVDGSVDGNRMNRLKIWKTRGHGKPIIPASEP